MIEGLDQLTKLRDLTFYNNKISTVGNMDTLTELQILSLGNNQLETLTDVSVYSDLKLNRVCLIIRG